MHADPAERVGRALLKISVGELWMQFRFLTVLSALGLPCAAVAQPQSQSSSPPASAQPKKHVDMNEIVCQKQEVVGSRLQTRRVCMTRGEWAEQQRIDRMDLDRVQTQRGCRSTC